MRWRVSTVTVIFLLGQKSLAPVHIPACPPPPSSPQNVESLSPCLLGSSGRNVSGFGKEEQLVMASQEGEASRGEADIQGGTCITGDGAYI